MKIYYKITPNYYLTILGEIIESSGRPRHLSIIPLKNFHLFKIVELVINFYFKKKKKFN